MSQSPWSYNFYRILWIGLDLILPPSCGGCGVSGSRWCVRCQQQVPLIYGPVCSLCGLPQAIPGLCPACQQDRPKYEVLRSWSVFADPVQEALHRLKYRRDIGLGDSLADQLTGFIRDLCWPIEMIIPIPLGWQRLKERGYNQVGLIARPLSMALGLEYAPRELTRRRETRSQVGLSRQARRENVRDAFIAGARVQGKNILLMDDVATTGSTLSSAAEALLGSGVKHVYALTVARALPQHGLGHA
jgi:competence protein ComFC